MGIYTWVYCVWPCFWLGHAVQLCTVIMSGLMSLLAQKQWLSLLLGIQVPPPPEWLYCFTQGCGGWQNDTAVANVAQRLVWCCLHITIFKSPGTAGSIPWLIKQVCPYSSLTRLCDQYLETKCLSFAQMKLFFLYGRQKIWQCFMKWMCFGIWTDLLSCLSGWPLCVRTLFLCHARSSAAIAFECDDGCVDTLSVKQSLLQVKVGRSSPLRLQILDQLLQTDRNWKVAHLFRVEHFHSW